MSAKPGTIPFTRRLPERPATLPHYQRVRENTYTLDYEREQRLLGWLFRLGFKVDQQAGDLDWHWIRLYNLNHGEPLEDWTHEKKPRLYSRGTVGVQISFRDTGGPHYTITVKVWRNDASPVVRLY